MTGRRVRLWRILCVLGVGIVAVTLLVSSYSNARADTDPTISPTPIPVNPTRAGQNAAAWAEKQLGKSAYVLQCQYFVEQAYNTSGRYANPLAMYADFKKLGIMHSDKNPPRGGIVIYNTTWVDKYGAKHHDGHTAIARGNGNVVTSPSGGSYDNGRVFSAKIDYFPNYLGWAYPPKSWGSR